MKRSSYCEPWIKELELRGGRPGPGTRVDQGGVNVVGWGHTVGGVRSVELPISHDTSDMLLVRDLDAVEKWLNSVVYKTKLMAYQFDALVSWAYHCSQGRAQTLDQQDYRTSKLMGHVTLAEFQLAVVEFDRWSIIGGKYNKFLSARRAAEAIIFSQGGV